MGVKGRPRSGTRVARQRRGHPGKLTQGRKDCFASGAGQAL